MELLGHDIVREFRAIAFTAQMGEIKVAKVCGHDLSRGLGGGFVGEMAMSAEDALLQAPGTAWAFLQHLHIVIGLQHQHVRGAGAFNHQLRHVPEISDESDVNGRGVNEKSNGVLRVVWNGKGVHDQVTDFEAGAGFKQVAVEFGLQLKFKRLLRSAVAINRNVQFLRNTGEPVNVVAVLVSDEDGGEVFRRASDTGEALPDLARTEPGVHQNAGFISLQIGAVTGRTAAENGEFDGHRWTLIARERGGKFFSSSAGIHSNEFGKG